jgi:multidrug efflux pump subunit AcrB
VLTVIPFGIMGAVLGHVTMSEVLSMFSFMGILATSGVVVNNNILLIDRINELRKQGMALKEALLDSALSRFRPILLTSVTTFLGTAPLMFGATGQSQFLVPMVISLSFGVMLSTVVALLFTPCFYLLMDGWKSRLAARLRLGVQRLRLVVAS